MRADVKIELFFLYSNLRTYNLLLHWFGLYHLSSRLYHRKFGICWFGNDPARHLAVSLTNICRIYGIVNDSDGVAEYLVSIIENDN
jgi:hypothetical protein